ncbi:MAG: hypothetical protein AAGL89_07315 [Pseudomonadota bacterium]
MKGVLSILVISLAGIATAGFAQDEEIWARTGVFWRVEPVIEPEPVIDARRVQDQLALGCSASGIAFGDTAQMRSMSGDGDWPRAVRNLVVSSALSDVKDDALALIEEAVSQPNLTTGQTATLQNRHILTALQFGDVALASGLLDRYATPADLPDPILSDRLFWSAYLGLNRDDRETWVTQHAEDLDRAMSLDPTSFQVRFLRAVGFIAHSGWQGVECHEAVRAFSDILLDMSEAGACSLMVGHMSYAIERDVGSMKQGRLTRQTRDWIAFANGLLGVISGNTAVVEEQSRALSSEASSPCGPLMSETLASVGGL